MLYYYLAYKFCRTKSVITMIKEASNAVEENEERHWEKNRLPHTPLPSNNLSRITTSDKISLDPT